MARQGGEPTEEPTARRLRQARARGETGLSRDLCSALTFAALVAVLGSAAPPGIASLLAFFQQSLQGSLQQSLQQSLQHSFAAAEAGAAEPAGLAVAGAAALHVLTTTLALPLGTMVVVGLLGGAMQTGGLFARQAVRVDFARLSPAAGLRNLFGARTLSELGKNLIKVAAVVLIAASSIGGMSGELSDLAGSSPRAVLLALGTLSYRLGTRAALTLVVLGAVDWLLSRRRHHRSLMMTREEVKRERKEAEGDPRHRAERQRLHREISEQRLLDDVRKADFIVVNPEHMAVAVSYDRNGEGAPVILAKGEKLIAERIKQMAREAGVPIYRDISLARALSALPEGGEIPEALYEAVATVLRALWDIDRASAGNTAVNGGDRPAGAAGAMGGVSAPPPSAWKRV